jgi:FAD/FMN-containing dehydrogenase
MARSTVSITVPEELAGQMPADPGDRQQVLVLGLREWRIRKALQAYKRGEVSLAYAAQQAGVSLREMIPLAYAHGLVPRVDPADLEISDLEAASRL